MTNHELTPEVISQIVDFAKKYEPKGDLVGIPLEVISKMLQRQYEQNGKWDIFVFEKDVQSYGYGFVWSSTIEEHDFWSSTIGTHHEPDFKTFFTRYPERFESEPQYKDSLGYPLEIGEASYFSDDSAKNCIQDDYVDIFDGIIEYGRYVSNHCDWKYAVSLKAYQNNPSEVMERIKQLEQPEPPKQEEKPTKPVYVTPCGTFTEGEVVEVKPTSGKRIFYRYDEKLRCPYWCVNSDDNANYIDGKKFNVYNHLLISKIPLPSIEEIASKAGISVEQLKEIVKEWK